MIPIDEKDLDSLLQSFGEEKNTPSPEEKKDTEMDESEFSLFASKDYTAVTAETIETLNQQATEGIKKTSSVSIDIFSENARETEKNEDEINMDMAATREWKMMTEEEKSLGDMLDAEIKQKNEMEEDSLTPEVSFDMAATSEWDSLMVENVEKQKSTEKPDPFEKIEFPSDEMSSGSEELNLNEEDIRGTDDSGFKSDVWNLNEEMPQQQVSEGISGDLVKDISMAFSAESADSRIEPEKKLPETESSYDTLSAITGSGLDKPAESSKIQDPDPEPLPEKESPRVAKAKKALEKIKEEPRKPLISGKRKRGIIARSGFYLMIFSLTSVFLYFGLDFFKKQPQFWYVPVCMTGILFLQFLFAIRKDWLPVTFYLAACFSVFMLLFPIVYPPDMNRLSAFFVKNPYPEMRLYFLLLCTVLVWMPLALTEIGKKTRYLLTIIGFYGFSSIIYVLKNGLTLEKLPEYSVFSSIQICYTYPFFLLINLFIPLSLSVTGLLMLFSFFRGKFISFLRCLFFAQISLFMLICGNLMLHKAGYMTPVLMFKQDATESIKTGMTDPDMSELMAFHTQLCRKMTSEVVISGGNAAVREVRQTDYPPGSFFFSQNRKCFLYQGQKAFFKRPLWQGTGSSG